MNRRLTAARGFTRDLLDYALVTAAITFGALAAIAIMCIPVWVCAWVVSQ